MPDLDIPLDDPLTTALPALIASDPIIAERLRTRVLELIDSLFDQIQDDLEEGDAATRSTVAKLVLPMFLKAHRDVDGSDTDATAEMMETVRATIAAMGITMPGASE